MKKILIISPHFPPSNLAAVHRSRLFAQHLPAFGWEPVVLTIHERFYEEKLDFNLSKLLPEDLRIEKSSAFGVTKPRFVGDIGLRGFFQLYRKAKWLITNEQFDFLYIPIPSFYVSLLGRWLHSSTGIKYGIDYIDPWVHEFSGTNKVFSRHWFSTKAAKFLEPIAVKKASIITGVAQGYYQGVIDRNPQLFNSAKFAAMPYGGEKDDHKTLAALHLQPYLFEKKDEKLQLVYAGAMLPKAHQPLEAIFSAISQQAEVFTNVEFHFIGCGKSSNDTMGFNIKPLAQKYGLWEKQVYEYPARIPYLDVLVHLNAANAVFILGSTEPHYTPSKVYQAVLSQKPILAILHSQSSAVQVVREAKAGLVLHFEGENGIPRIEYVFVDVFRKFEQFVNSFNPDEVDLSFFEQYSSKKVTAMLVEALDGI